MGWEFEPLTFNLGEISSHPYFSGFNPNNQARFVPNSILSCAERND